MAAAMTVTMSCSVDKETPAEDVIQSGQLTITASFAEEDGDDDTRTALQESGSVWWNPGDAISLFYGSGSNGGSKFTAQATESTAITNFSGSIGVITGGGEISFEDTWFWATYPYNASASCDGSSITTVLPSEQVGKAGTFADNTFITIARSQGLILSFYNVCSGLKFSVTNSNVKKVSIKSNGGEKIAGKANIKFDGNGIPYIASLTDGSDEITVNAPDGGCFEVGESYYIIMFPQVLASGFTVTLETSDKYATREITKSAEFKRSVFNKMMDADKTVVYEAESPQPLKFTANSAQTITLQNHGGNAPSVEYSYDGNNWNTWDYSSLTFGTDNKSVYIRGNNSTGFSISETIRSQFSFGNSDVPVTCEGDVMSLIDYTKTTTSIPCNYCFFDLFYNHCTSLTTAPELPATALADYCYASMFEGCTSLTIAPELPATTLAYCCFFHMFSGCTSLTTTPAVLPATILAESCYSNMFSDCTSLSVAPELPATTLASGCYSDMFYNCTSLTTAPELHATTLAASCYSSMFSGCTSLSIASELPATTLEKHCYDHMFANCTSLSSAPAKLPATTLADYCYQGMFVGCKDLTAAPELPATTLAEGCYTSMFYGCKSLTVAPELPATNLAEHCYYSMFQGCSNLVTAPELPATILTKSCYYCMFYKCSNLSYVKALFTTVPSSSCISYWLDGVSSTGTFVKNSTATWDVTGSSGVPSGWTIETVGISNNHEYVDLGLSVKWATCNVGASKPEDYGDYYAWGATETFYEPCYAQEDPQLHWKSDKPYGYTIVNAPYQTANVQIGYDTRWTKYLGSTTSEYKDVNATANDAMKAVLDSEDDAAHANWGGNWRMPTQSEIFELLDCTWTWTTINGINGYKVQGYTDSWIFLPAAGYRIGDELDDVGSDGFYWSKTLGHDEADPSSAFVMNFDSSFPYFLYNWRYIGYSIRPVCP